jgi:predicted flap endonuclease-1-like 5' DNA nuclease
MVRTVIGVLAGLVLAVGGVSLFVWLLWWLWTRREEQQAPFIELKTEPPAPPIEPPAVEEKVEETPEIQADADVEKEKPLEKPAAPDDLKRIEGIGPKIASVLQEAGITTFARLADAQVSDLEQVLEAADPRLLRLAKPAAWPEQAALAAAGEWDALEALQRELKGGRRA